MNEFEGKTKKELEMAIISLESYKRGSLDKILILNEMGDRTRKLYDEKIKLCQEVIKNFNEK